MNPVSYTLYSVAYRTVDAFNTQEQNLKQFAVYASANFTRYSVVDSFDVQLLASVAYVSYTLCSEVHSSCNVQLIGAKSLPCIVHTVLRSTQFVQRSTDRSKITTSAPCLSYTLYWEVRTHNVLFTEGSTLATKPKHRTFCFLRRLSCCDKAKIRYRDPESSAYRRRNSWEKAQVRYQDPEGSSYIRLSYCDKAEIHCRDPESSAFRNALPAYRTFSLPKARLL